MNSIQFHSSFSSLLSHNSQQFNTHRLLSPHSSQEAAPKHGQRMPYIKSRAAIITNSLIILAETAPVPDPAPFKGGDLSVLLPTGGLMLFVYFITNFVVPAFIIKGYEGDKETEDLDKFT